MNHPSDITQGVARVAPLFTYNGGSATTARAAAANLSFVPQQPLIPNELLKVARASSSSSSSSLLGVSLLTPENSSSGSSDIGKSEPVNVSSAVNAPLQVPGKIQIIPPFAFNAPAAQTLPRMANLVPSLPHTLFETGSVQTSSTSSTPSPVVATNGLISAPNASMNRTSAQDATRPVSQFIGIDHLTQQQQSALLLTSLALAGANPTMLAPQNTFGSPISSPASILFTDQAGNPAPFSPSQNGSPSAPALLHHAGSRHSPIRHRRMRRVAENVARSMTNPSSNLRLNVPPTKMESASPLVGFPSVVSRNYVGSPSGMGIDSSKITLSLQQQPPERTVYLKILKPFPVVKLNFSALPQSEDDKKQLSRLFVEASLVRQQSGEDISSCLEGTRMVQVIGMNAVFRKLKILCTSQQQNSNMCIKFSLFQFTSSGCEHCPGCVITSQPIEVYSHPVYLSPDGSVYAQQQQQSIMACHGLRGTFSHQALPLRRRRSSDTSTQENSDHSCDSVVITAIVPDVIVSGEKVVLLGSGFQDIATLRVTFGSLLVKPEFNDSSTLVCIVPDGLTPNDENGSVHVKLISTDGIEVTNTFVEAFTVNSKKGQVDRMATASTATDTQPTE